VKQFAPAKPRLKAPLSVFLSPSPPQRRVFHNPALERLAV
jgi:hypothetical protein